MSLAPVAGAPVQTQYPYTSPSGTSPLTTSNFGTDIETWTGNPALSPGSYTV
jgi:hypothetical protein